MGLLSGMLVIFLGAFISSFIIFFAVRKLGRNFIYSFISKEQVEKFENSKWFSDPKKIYFTLFILFLIPGTPKDLIVYISGLLPINPLKFLLISTFARFPSIISSTIAGSNIVDGNWHIIIGTYGITFILSGLLIFMFGRNKSNNA